MATFSEESTHIFKRTLPKTANIKNPVDVIGDARADRYTIAVSTALKDPNVDGVFVILTPQSMTDIETIANEVCSVADQFEKPVYASFMGEADVAAGISILQRNKIPHYILPESMSRAFAAACRFAGELENGKTTKVEAPKGNRERAKEIFNGAVDAGRNYLPEEEAVQVLKAYGLPVLNNGMAHSETDAARIAAEIGFPVVMKVMSDDIIHKFDVKGVVLNIKNEAEAKDAYTSIMNNVSKLVPDARIKGIFVTKMIPAGEEVIIGLKRDPSFGPTIMFGLGGIFVEIFKDVSFRIAPVDAQSAETMIDDIKMSQILKGARGRKPRDLETLKLCIQRISRLAIDCPEIQELDINPLIVLEKGKGAFVADAKIML
jgi:acetyltransferase